jgi:hypothetical protein
MARSAGAGGLATPEHARSVLCYGDRMYPPTRQPPPPVDPATLEHVLRLLTERLDAVVTYGAGGCPSCHDAELRGAIAIIRGLLPATAAAGRSGGASGHGAR